MESNRSYVLVFCLVALLAVSSNAFVLSGTIRNEDGIRLTGTKVELLQTGVVIASTIAATEGFYSLNFSTPGTYTIRTTRQGYPNTIALVNVAADSTRDIVMHETTLSSLYGQVFFEGGSPTSIAKVRLSKGGVLVVGAESMVQPDGSYAITGIQPGDYNVTLPDGNYTYEQKNISFLGGDSLQLNLYVYPKTGQSQNATPIVKTQAYKIVVPTTSIQGAQVKVVVFDTADGTVPYAGVVLRVTGDNFENTLAPTDPSGQTYFTPSASGTYVFSLPQSNATASISVLPNQQVAQPDQTTGGTSSTEQPFVWPTNNGTVTTTAFVGIVGVLLVVAIALAAAVAYIVLRHKKNEGKPQPEQGQQEEAQEQTQAPPQKPKRQRKKQYDD